TLPTLALQEREKVDVDFGLVRAREPALVVRDHVISLRYCESLGIASRITTLAADHAPTALIACPDMSMPVDPIVPTGRKEEELTNKFRGCARVGASGTCQRF